ncbi:ArsR family transcriptional regulator [Streptomyces dioscori]|uniref:ArsR family transcriptional regulator n=2 Tax=Streptomyces dioscori TaxID=2109333 RepID=A0A2P8Q8W3_9ACTN|nr:ArsR family transcriptional regulator [Streptomyces dioscori]
MLHIHFSMADLSRIRIAQEPDPAWEILLSLHALGGPADHVVFGPWRSETLTRLDPSARMLLALAPPRGYSPDFLTPAGAPDVRSVVDAVLSTGRGQLRADLAQLAVRRRTPSWTRLLAEGDLETLGRLGSALNRYHDRVLARRWDRIRAVTEADRALRARDFLDGGAEGLLGGLGPAARWEAPVLTVDYPLDQQLRLRGRGLRLIPSYFCWRRPITLLDEELTPVLVYPANRGLHLLTGPERPGRSALARLLGRARASVLEEIALSGGTTEGDIARRLGMSPASASAHTAVLRGTGLIATHGVADTARHTLTPLGLSLIEGHLPVDGPPYGTGPPGPEH